VPAAGWLSRQHTSSAWACVCCVVVSVCGVDVVSLWVWLFQVDVFTADRYSPQKIWSMRHQGHAGHEMVWCVRTCWFVAVAGSATCAVA
jgi:hypothetical protein